MAPPPAPAEKPKSLIYEVGGWFIALWLLWIFGGGPTRADQISKPFMRPPNPLNNGATYKEVPLLNILELKKNLQVKTGKDYSSAHLSVLSDKETGTQIIELAVLPTSKNSINITGWKVKGVVDSEARVIGKGVEIFKQGKINEDNDIIIYPGEKALILPGPSPVGVSFKLNKCTGYLEQFQAFTPHLPQSCPQPGLDEYQVADFDGACTPFLKSIMRCNSYLKEFPENISKNCQDIVSKRLNYNSCVDESSQDYDFKKAEWRVYVGGTNSFASNFGDMISVFDTDGSFIETIFYSK